MNENSLSKSAALAAIRSNRRLAPFEKEWLSLFAGNLDANELAEHVLSDGNYIWHIFSWELLPKDAYLTGEEARRAFDAQDKTGAAYFEPWPCQPVPAPAFVSPSAADVEERIECYVLSRDRTWTYIKTHEGDCCGPYFCRLPALP